MKLGPFYFAQWSCQIGLTNSNQDLTLRYVLQPPLNRCVLYAIFEMPCQAGIISSQVPHSSLPAVQRALPTLWYTSINSAAAAIYIAEETDEKFGGLPPPSHLWFYLRLSPCCAGQCTPMLLRFWSTISISISVIIQSYYLDTEWLPMVPITWSEIAWHGSDYCLQQE